MLAIVAAEAVAQTSNVQQPGAVQTAPVTEPGDSEHEPAGPPVAKGAAAITQRKTRCTTRIVVKADALFAPRRWTLNPDAFVTLDVLAPMVARGGSHPVRIEAFTASEADRSDSRSLSEKRAITVRGWLMNKGWVPENTPIAGFAVPDRTSGSCGVPEGAQKNSCVEVVIETCR